jgi:hypothetical protein
MNLQTRVIGNWQPLKLNDASIYYGLMAEVRKTTGKTEFLHYQIRSPKYYLGVNPNYYSHLYEFHQDALGNRKELILVVWSNLLPTEVVTDNKLLETRAGDIVLINNLTSFHRAPNCLKESNGLGRWMARFIVAN